MDNKETLKTYYETGDKPTQEQFEKLIYACVGTLEKTDDLPVATSAQENVIYQIGKAFYQCKVLSGIYGWQYIGSLGTDEKVKYDAGDTTAGYIADKFVAGTGISLAEGTGANENKLVITNTEAGSGDMSAATYDPTNVAGDAFDMDNMIEGDTNLILTADERTKIGNALTYFTLTYYQAKPATCATGETCFDNTDGKIYTATGTDTWDSGVAASTSVLYVWQYRIYEFVTGTTLKPLSYGRKLRKSPTVTSNAFSWKCSGERSKSYVSNNANTTCTVTPTSGDEDTEHSLLFTNSDSSASHTISFAAASGFTLKMTATTLTIPASGFVELSVELYGTVCYIKYSIN